MSNSVNRRRALAATIFALMIAGALFFESERSRSAAVSVPDFALAEKFAGEDAATRAIRNESNKLTRIPVKSDADREAAERVGRIVQDYGTFVLVAKGREMQARAFGLDEQAVETTVNLPSARFEPVEQPPAGSLRLGPGASASGKGYYVVQFGGTATDEWLKSLAQAGVEVLQYIPHQAYFVHADAESIARVAGHSRVRWIGRYTAEQKITQALRMQLDAARKQASPGRSIPAIRATKQGTATFDVAVFARADLDAVAAEIRESFGKGPVSSMRVQSTYFNVVRAELALDDVEKVAALEDVISIQAVFPTRNEDERANQILAGNYQNATTLIGPGYDPLGQFGTDGTNVTVAVVDDGVGIPGDGGFYISGANAVAGALRGTTPGANGHGHFNATIIAGSLTPLATLDLLGFNYGLGVAPKSHIVNIPRNRPGYTGTDVQVFDDSVTTPALNGRTAFISNNSWGGEIDKTYDTGEAVFDAVVRDASLDPNVYPLALVFSAGNAGAAGMTHPKAAKNLIAVGNSESIRPEKGGANNMDDIAADSSRGPTADGRIKPDVVAPGTAVTGGRSGPNTLSGNIDAAHRWSSGTSHAAAHISGLAALFTQWWYDRNFGDVPSPSMMKAAMINSAVDLNGGNSSEPIPNAAEGWGRPYMKRMFTPGVGMKYIDEPFPIQTTGTGFTLEGSVADASKPLRITLAWTDPPGASDPALVNDLDLIVTVGGVEYKGNVFSNGASVTGGAFDSRNNVENVFLPAGVPAGASLSIFVRATALNGDGDILTMDGTDQRYSLVVHNWSGIVSPGSYRMEGRVISADGRGIGFAKVRITDVQGGSRETRTNPLGYFRFAGVPGGQTYTVNIDAKRYTFVQQNVSLTNNMSNLVFRAEPGAP